jgi:hypothetical protein
MSMETSPPVITAFIQPERKNNAAAVAAGACGIGSIAAQLLAFGVTAIDPSLTGICNAIGGLAWVAGIVLGVVGLVQIHRHPEERGRGWAIAGIGLGILRICIVLISILLITGTSIGTVSTLISATLIAP